MGYVNGKSGVSAWGNIGRIDGLEFKGSDSKPFIKFSVAIGKNENLSTFWANCEAWRGTAEYIDSLGLKKGDVIKVDGYWRKNEYNGKDYWNLVVEFAQAMTPPVAHAKSKEEFIPIDNEADESDLPF